MSDPVQFEPFQGQQGRRGRDTPWRLALVPAAFRGNTFHVEQGNFSGGRRIALHEYPKRDNPYAEDMGRRTRHYVITGYLIGPNYHLARDKLKDALEREGSGALTIYQSGSSTWRQTVVCDEFAVIELRERGGYCVFEMHFTEAGAPGNAVGTAQTQAVVNSVATAAEAAASSSFTQSVTETNA